MKCYLRVILGRKGSFAAERLRILGSEVSKVDA